MPDQETETILSLAAWRKIRAGQLARRPDGQTANLSKGSSFRPGVDKLTIRVPSQIAFKFREFCKDADVEQSKLIAELIVDFFLQIENGPARRPDGQTATIRSRDDLDPEDLKPDQRSDDEENIYQASSVPDQGPARRPDGQQPVEIPVEGSAEASEQIANEKRRHVLAFYTKLTGNRPGPKDLQAVEEILAYPLHVIRTGIGKCAYFAKDPIRAFRYFVEEIHAFGAEDPGPEYYSQHIERILIKAGRLQGPEPAMTRQPNLPGTGGLTELDNHQRKDGTQ